MKFKIFSMLIILGVISVMPMIYMGKFDPMAFFDAGFKDGLSEFNKLKAKAPESLSSVVSDEKVQVYKWRDEFGVMQFSNTPPASGAAAEKIELNTNNNIMQAVKLPKKNEDSKRPAEVAVPSPYSLKGGKKILQDAKGIEAMLQKRHEEQQKMLNNL
ncbi:MAG: hypothetical protein COB77_01515 [Gammaproteobacteria bacterium]|nr:MAG: hypothetical protein COB77_01515 [Gammaproteobacteria bacterium]